MIKKVELREGWISLLLLLGMGLCLAWTLQAAELATGIWVLQWVVIVGTLVGFALSRTRIPALISHAASIIIGAGWGVFVTGLLLPGNLAWVDRFLNIRLRILDWWQQAVGSGESYDTLMFILFTTLLFWGFSYIASFSVYRAHWVWGAIIPNGTVILMNTYYNHRLMPYFISYLLLSLLMIVRFTLFEREDEWRREDVRYSPDLIFDFLQNGAISAVVVIAMAWLIPLTVSDPREWKVWDNFEDPWQEVQFHWNRVFANLNYTGQPRFSFFAQSMTLGGPVNLSTDPIMEVKSEEPHHWRALVFDEYTGYGWRNTDPEEIELEANATSPRPLPYLDRSALVQTIRFFDPGEKVIFGANALVSVNRAATARVTYLPPLTGGGGTTGDLGQTAEISSMATKLRLRRNESYQVISLVSKAGPSKLRQAGSAYPDWVRARYIGLPPTVPDRVRKLAQQITAPYQNSYDKATAIERYLRQLTYNENIDAPPGGVDAVDWFLFEIKEGYCDYYSSAMAVLLRAVGIPARVARGYATGEYNADTGVYTVRELDAHAWPEVYFVGYGWVDFEPTASEPLVERPMTEEEQQEEAAIAAAEEQTTGPTGRDLLPEEEDQYQDAAGPWTLDSKPWYDPERLLNSGWPQRIGVVAVILLLLWIIRAIIRHRRGPTSLVTFAFDDMIKYARWLGVRLSTHQTPYECAAALSRVIEEGDKEIKVITDLYVKERYGKEPINTYDEMNAMDAWRRLREALWVYLILKYLPIKKETAQSLRAARPSA